MKKLLLLASVSSIILSCKNNIEPVTPKPTAEFTYSLGNGGYASFSNVSTNSDNHKWDFGDGQVSFLDNPDHFYIRNGTYQVVLTSNGKGGSDVKVRNIVINSVKGSLVVYKNFSTGNTNINVWVDNNFVGVINGSYYYTSAPNCGNPYSVTATNLSEGVHTITAKQVSGLLPSTWSGTISVIGAGCSSFGLR